MSLPKLALTMGDVAGIGPEIIARLWNLDGFTRTCEPIVVGHPAVLERAMSLVGSRCSLKQVRDLSASEAAPDQILCFNPAGDDARLVMPQKSDARSGRAAYEYIKAATNAALEGTIDGIVTAPISKLGLSLAKIPFPGQTELLASLCGVSSSSMMLYLGRGVAQRVPEGLAVVHVTLHTSIRSVPDQLSTAKIIERIQSLHDFLLPMIGQTPRIGVCALNPHAGEEGLFGDEEQRLIAPAVEKARQQGVAARGPFPADTLMMRACDGEFDGVVAMYHDQGHIAIKLVSFNAAVNITLGLPIIRTSPSHGTATDIAWSGAAAADGMASAVQVAVRLAEHRRSEMAATMKTWIPGQG